MTEAPDTAKPRRRWKRWVVLTLVLMIGCGAWLAGGDSETIRKARGLRLGMSEAEVLAIMGEPFESSTRMRARAQSPTQTLVYATPTEERLFQAKLLMFECLELVGLGELVMGYPWHPVVVATEGGRVVQFRRGHEIVGE